ncbi:MAG: type II secretion system protein [Planctomycetota bacterium]
MVMKFYSRSKSINNSLFLQDKRSGFTFLEVISATAVISIISYLIITQIIMLQSKISKYTQLPEQGHNINSALSDAVPFEDNFKKGNLSNYTNDNSNWQLKREVIKIYQDKEKEYFVDQYILTIETGPKDSTTSAEFFFLKTIEDEKDIEEKKK